MSVIYSDLSSQDSVINLLNNPASLNSFQALISQLLKVCIITAMVNHNFIYFSADQICDLSCIHLQSLFLLDDF